MHASPQLSTARRPLPAPENHRILILIQLDGGNDGLNTVIPYGDARYYQARPHLGIAPEHVLQLDDAMGLHPELVELHQLYQEGSLAILQNVGYPRPNRSHFASMDIWHKAVWCDPTQPVEVFDGWLGRYFAQACAHIESPALGLQIGDRTALAFASDQPRCVTIANPAILAWPEYAEALTNVQNGSLDSTTPQDPFLYVQQIAQQTLTLAERLRAARQAPSRAAYAPFQLSQALRLIGQMIAADMPTRIYYTSMSGFDTHVGQAGMHAGLLQELSQAIGAFALDMQAAGHWERTLLLTVSEFGRRVQENTSRGTDHGAASIMFAAGGAVVPGLHGIPPDLDALEDGDLQAKIDFRSVYAAVLQDWLHTHPQPILLGEYAPFPFLATGP